MVCMRGGLRGGLREGRQEAPGGKSAKKRKRCTLQFTSEGGGGARIQTHHLLSSGIMEGRAASWGRSFSLKMEKLKMEKFWRWMVVMAAQHRE